MVNFKSLLVKSPLKFGRGLVTTSHRNCGYDYSSMHNDQLNHISKTGSNWLHNRNINKARDNLLMESTVTPFYLSVAQCCLSHALYYFSPDISSIFTATVAGWTTQRYWLNFSIGTNPGCAVNIRGFRLQNTNHQSRTGGHRTDNNFVDSSSMAISFLYSKTESNDVQGYISLMNIYSGITQTDRFPCLRRLYRTIDFNTMHFGALVSLYQKVSTGINVLINNDIHRFVRLR